MELPGWNTMFGRGQGLAAGPLMSPGQVLSLQQTAGNRATADLIGRARYPAVQRDVETDYGTFAERDYRETVRTLGSKQNQVRNIGVLMVLGFTPNESVVDARQIGLTQAIRSYREGRPYYYKPAHQSRTRAGQPGQGYMLDRGQQYENSPIYGATPQPATATLEETPTSEQGAQTAVPDNSTYQTGYRYRGDDDTVKAQDAWLKDSPEMDAAANSGQVFETTALVLKGKQAGTYLGSVKWGWSSDDGTKAEKLKLELVSRGDPSSNFIEAAKKWNEAIVNPRGAPEGQTTKDTVVMEGNGRPMFTLGSGWILRLEQVRHAGGVGYAEVRILPQSPPKQGVDPQGNPIPVANKRGWVRLTDISQAESSQRTIPLPIPALTKRLRGG
jgi:hypothetical protein